MRWPPWPRPGTGRLARPRRRNGCQIWRPGATWAPVRCRVRRAGGWRPGGPDNALRRGRAGRVQGDVVVPSLRRGPMQRMDQRRGQRGRDGDSRRDGDRRQSPPEYDCSPLPDHRVKWKRARAEFIERGTKLVRRSRSSWILIGSPSRRAPRSAWAWPALAMPGSWLCLPSSPGWPRPGPRSGRAKIAERQLRAAFSATRPAQRRSLPGRRARSPDRIAVRTRRAGRRSGARRRAAFACCRDVHWLRSAAGRRRDRRRG